jgi:hypothetical protein
MIYKMPKIQSQLKEQIEMDKKELIKLTEENRNESKEIFEKLKKETLPEIEEKISNLISSIKTTALLCNPREILDYFASTYGLTTTDKLLEDIDSSNSAYLDYILSLVTSLDYIDINNNCSEENLKNLKKDIEELYQQVVLSKMATSDEMKFLQSIHNLAIRGNSYTKHQIELCKELFFRYDHILKERYKITSLDLIDELINIANCSLSNSDVQFQYMREMKNAHEVFIKDSEIAKKNNRLEGFMQSYQKSDALKKTRENLQKINDETNISINDSIFKIHHTKLPKDILEQLSMSIGENKIFEKGDQKYFPANNSQIYEKPLIKIDNEYYCFNSPNIFYNLHFIIENLILNLIPENKRSKQYSDKKGVFLEDKSLHLFKKLLPNAKIYKNLKYNGDDEVDGIIIYDNRIFIIEAKSSKFSLGAKKGSIGSIKSDTKKIIEKAYQQAIRAKNYILSNNHVAFKNDKKETILTIDTTKVSDIYMINTTLESLGHITSNLNSLERFGFIKGKDWIWSVYLNDLRIISEIITSPTEFILYLERRIKFNDYPQIHTMEEIDIFGYFLHNGLYFDDIDFPKDNYMMQMVGFTQKLDEYYYWKEGNLEEEKEKPSFIDKCETKEIVNKVENINKENFLTLSKFLLSYDGQHQSEIKKQVVNILIGRRKNFSMFIEHENIGFTFMHNKFSKKENMQFYCKVMAYERRINNWFLIYVEGSSQKDFELDFDSFNFTNEHNEILENEVKELQERRLKESLEVNKKIGRNDLCPCGSGKKYKRCCL